MQLRREDVRMSPTDVDLSINGKTLGRAYVDPYERGPERWHWAHWPDGLVIRDGKAAGSHGVAVTYDAAIQAVIDAENARRTKE
jgi:hypothetical protein